MNIYEKLAAVQQELKAPKDKKNNFAGYSYRSAEGILEAVKPVLAKYEALIAISDEIIDISGRIYVKATATFLDRKDGAAIQVTAYAREAAEKKGLDVSQVTGTASSYARKYALNGLLLIDDTKDPDTDEYAKQTGSDQNTNGPAEQSKATEKTLSEEKKAVIRALAEKAKIDIKDTGEDLDKMTDRRGSAMITALKLKIQNEAK